MSLKFFQNVSIKTLLKPPSPSLNFSRRRINRIIESLPSEINILDLGSGHRKLTGNAINLDIIPFKYVDIAGDGHNLPLKNNVFDLVICQAVLEHVEEPNVVVKEIRRVLKNKGTIYVEIPFLQGFHADPVDYQRFTIKGMERLLRPFEKEHIGICVGPVSTLSWWLRKFPTIFFKNKHIIKAIEFCSGWSTFWVKYLDFIFIHVKNAHILSAGFYFTGKKSDDNLPH